VRSVATLAGLISAIAAGLFGAAAVVAPVAAVAVAPPAAGGGPPGRPPGAVVDADNGWAGRGAAENRGVANPRGTGKAGPAAIGPPAGYPINGIDVSSHDHSDGRTVNWAGQRAAGDEFAYVKATEGTGYVNPYFAQQYNGSYGAGLVRGAYHFALPDRSSGTTQADYFVSHGGGWSSDGKTLPPLLDIEYNPYGSTCYGLSSSSMVSWISAFRSRVRARTGRYPALYTTTNWWSQCTGNTSAFGSSPLFLARYSSSPGTLPAGWGTYTFWQYSDSGSLPGDQDLFHGSLSALQSFARG
jgi:GH25 family lysozyme M1 (1,4-beta-N-acetylmuramidase)